MENPPTAAGEAPQAPQTEANPTPTTNTEPAQAPVPNLHGFTEDQLAEMEKFYSANGGYEKAFGRVKSAISNPQPVQPQEQPQEQQPQYQQPQYQQPQPQYRPPEGAITPQEFLAQQYFQGLSRDPRYEAISDQIASGSVLKEMAGFNIQPLNQDGSINDTMVRRYLDLKAQTVPAKPTESEPNASAAPTVTYTPVGDNIASIDEAYKVIMEKGHPATAKAEEFIKNYYSNSGKK